MKLQPEYRWIIAATLVMASALGIARFAYTPLLPQMISEFGWSFAAAGDVASANFLGYTVGAFLAPRVTQSQSVRLWVALSFMASVATTYLGAEFCRLVNGAVYVGSGQRFLFGHHHHAPDPCTGTIGQRHLRECSLCRSGHGHSRLYGEPYRWGRG